MSKNKNVIFESVRFTFHMLNSKERTKGAVLLILIVIGGGFDVLGLAAVLPVITIALDFNKIESIDSINYVYNLLGFESHHNFFLFIVISLVGVFILKNIVTFIIFYFQAKFSLGVAEGIATKQFHRYMDEDLDYINETPSSHIITWIVNYPRFFSQSILLPLINFFSDLFVVLVIVIGVGIINIKILIMLMVIMGVAFLLIYRGTKNKVESLSERLKEIMPKPLAAASQSIAGYIDLRINNRVDFFVMKFNAVIVEANNITALRLALGIIPKRASEVIAIMGISMIILFAVFVGGGASGLLELMMVFAGAAYRVMPALSSMLTSIINIKNHKFLLEEMEPISKGVFTPSWHKDQDPVHFYEKLEIRNLSFSYPGEHKLAVKNLNFSIKKGEMVGFVGKSGAGKTTFMNIFLRFLTETQGGIFVDDVKITARNRLSWWEKIAYVQQEVFILDGSIIENVALGLAESDVDMDKVKSALEQAKLTEYVAESKDGLLRNIGEKGAKISGGQRQRIGIARALYRDAEIILFDEATSALDPKTEKEITTSMKQLAELGKTIMIVAHRFTTLEHCDRILEFSEGELKKEWKYSDLMRSSLAGSLNLISDLQ